MIRDLIVAGELVPNDRLIEVELAARLGTNRSNVRIALGRLEQEGLVTSELNHGARVRVVEREEALEIFEARGALEALVVRMAARHGTPGSRKRMRCWLNEMSAHLGNDDLAAFSASLGKLRSEIWKASRHATAERLLSSLNYHLVRYRYRSSAVPGRAPESLAQITAVVEAVCAGDPDAAEAAMAAFTRGAIASLRRSFRRH